MKPSNITAFLALSALVSPSIVLSDDGETGEGASLSMNWRAGKFGLVADYSELELWPALAPGLRETTTRLRGIASLNVRSDLEIDFSAFGVVDEDESGRSNKGAGARVGLKFKK